MVGRPLARSEHRGNERDGLLPRLWLRRLGSHAGGSSPARAHDKDQRRQPNLSSPAPMPTSRSCSGSSARSPLRFRRLVAELRYLIDNWS
jgi:hypothetical protein